MKKDSYLDFLETKKKARTYSGFEVADNDLNPLLLICFKTIQSQYRQFISRNLKIWKI